MQVTKLKDEMVGRAGLEREAKEDLDKSIQS